MGVPVLLYISIVTSPVRDNKCRARDQAIFAIAFTMNSRFVFELILLATYLSSSPVTAENDCKRNELKSVALQQHLLCSYDKTVRPSESGPTLVNLKVAPRFIEFLDESHDLVAHSWLWVSWDDAHFTWDPNNGEYAGINMLHVSSYDLWTPGLTVYNIGETSYDTDELPPTTCMVSHNKKVQCVAAVRYMARCAANFRHWPFDSQNCTIRLGSWAYTKDEVDYELNMTGIDMLDYTESHNWKLLSVNVSKQMVHYRGYLAEHPSVFINFVLERYSADRQATVIVPAVLLIITTITVLWLDPMSVERMILAGLNLICHILCIMDVNWQVPANGGSLPSILIFHKNSMIIAGVAFFLTAFLRQLKEISIPPPVWLTSTASVLLGTKTGQFVLLTTLDPKASATMSTAEEDNAGLVQLHSSSLPKINPASANAWHHFATLIDRVSFAAIVVTYVIMIFVLTPKNDLVYH